MNGSKAFRVIALIAGIATLAAPAAAGDFSTTPSTTTTSGGGTTTTTQGTATYGGVTGYGQSQTFSTSTTPGSNPGNSQTTYGVGVQIPFGK